MARTELGSFLASVVGNLEPSYTPVKEPDPEPVSAKLLPLIGATVVALSVSDGEERLCLTLDNGRYLIGSLEADCCSQSWFADITGVDALLGGTIAHAEEVDEKECEDGRTRQEYDRVYGIKVTTNKGYCDIVFRNSSNGYYGGWLIGFEETTVAPEDFVPITDDWSA